LNEASAGRDRRGFSVRESYQKYEADDKQWYDLFQKKIVYEEGCPPKQKEIDL